MKVLSIPAAVVLATTSIAVADVSMPSVFSDHMVLQRDMPIAIWGTADPGSWIAINLESKKGTSTKYRSVAQPVGRNGEWRATLSPIESTDGNWTLTVTEYDTHVKDERAKTSEVLIKNILVGEVWLCGGQSNMEWVIDRTDATPQQKQSMNDTRIRLIKAPHVVATEAKDDIPAQWQICAPEVVGNWSAVGYYFARALQDELDVPVGLISSNWGGTRIEPWIQRNDLANHPRFSERTKALQRGIDEYHSMDDATRKRVARAMSEKHEEKEAAYWRRVLANDPGLENGWMLPEFDAQGWQSMTLPGLWEQKDNSLASYDGTIWFRKEVKIPADWAGNALVLDLGRIDDSDRTWFNGKEVGSTTNQHQKPRTYNVNGRMVKGGTTTISVCVLDPHGAGGFNGPKMQLARADGKGTPINLAGEWKWHQGVATNLAAPTLATVQMNNPGMNPQAPGALNDAMIAPFVPYTLRGAIWYQGESNSGQPDEYRDLLPLLIKSWREDFGDHLAFGVVQLAAFKATSDDPVQGGWANLRDAQLNTVRTVPGTGLAVTTDVGDAKDIHPKNKKAVGDRLAAWALHDVYGVEDAIPSGPIHSGSTPDGNGMVLNFDHAHGGLSSVSGGEEIGGFAIAGADGRFSWAKAQVTGPNSVRVWSNDVPEPHIVRYGWQDNPVRADLVNGAGLPASPFRTDDPGTPSD